MKIQFSPAASKVLPDDGQLFLPKKSSEHSLFFGETIGLTPDFELSFNCSHFVVLPSTSLVSDFKVLHE